MADEEAILVCTNGNISHFLALKVGQTSHQSLIKILAAVLLIILCRELSQAKKRPFLLLSHCLRVIAFATQVISFSQS